MGNLMLRLRAWWETADRTQKVVTIFGSAFLVLLLGGTFFFASRPKMAMVYGGLQPADQGKVVAEIQKLGIPVEFDLQGNVSVPSDKVALVQSTLAKNGQAPMSGNGSGGDMMNINPMSPRSVTEVQLTAHKQAEIQESLEALNGVSSVRVLLNMGDKGPFSSEDSPPSASVTITEDPGFDLSGAPAKAMAQLVARSVTGLTTKNVTIVNQDGLSLFDGLEAEGTQGLSNNKIAAQIQAERRIKRELQPILDRFGIGNTMLTVRVEMDFDKKSERTVQISPKKAPTSLATVEENMSGPGSDGGTFGLAGAASNTEAPAIGDADKKAGQKSFISKQSSGEYPYDHSTIETEKAPGTIKGMAISVVVNSDAPEGQEPVDPIAVESAVKGYLGALSEQQGFSVTVTEAKFDNTVQKDLQSAASAAAGRDRMQQIMAILPIAALLLVAVIVLKALKGVASSTNVVMHALPDGRVVAMPAGKASQSALPEPGEEEWEEFLEADPNNSEAAPIKRRRRKNALPEEDDDDEAIRVGRISEKVNVPLEQLKKMANQKPEAIAMLLKSWLVEERR